MNYTLFSLYANIFGFVAGGISLLSLIVAACRPHLPSNKIKTLETLLHETETTFKEAVEAELLVPDFVAKTENNLIGLKEQACTLQARAYNVTTLYRDCAEFLRGTSNAIGRTCQSVKQLRAEVITSSQERRRRLLQTNSEQTCPRPALPSNQMSQHHYMPTPPTLFPRPRSCPPAFSTCRSNDVRIVFVENSRLSRLGIEDLGHPEGIFSLYPLRDSSRSDLDVRGVDVQL